MTKVTTLTLPRSKSQINKKTTSPKLLITNKSKKSSQEWIRCVSFKTVPARCNTKTCPWWRRRYWARTLYRCCKTRSRTLLSFRTDLSNSMTHHDHVLASHNSSLVMGPNQPAAAFAPSLRMALSFQLELILQEAVRNAPLPRNLWRLQKSQQIPLQRPNFKSTWSQNSKTLQKLWSLATRKQSDPKSSTCKHC